MTKKTTIFIITLSLLALVVISGCVQDEQEDCLQVYEPVCGKNGQTYSNDCVARQKDVKIDYRGECKEEPKKGKCGDGLCDEVEKANPNLCPKDCQLDVCPQIYDPVCGKDNKTYANPCIAEQEGVEVAYQGECKEEPLPSKCGDGICDETEKQLGGCSKDCKEPSRIDFEKSPFGIHGTYYEREPEDLSGENIPPDLREKLTHMDERFKSLGVSNYHEHNALVDNYIQELGTMWNRIGISPTEDFDKLIKLINEKDYQIIVHTFSPNKKEIKEYVERYDGDGIDDMPGLKMSIKYWQYGGEPDLKVENPDKKLSHAQNYASELKTTYLAVKEVCSDCQVLIGGMSGAFDIEYYEEVLNNSGGDYFDIYDFHHFGGFSESYRETKTRYDKLQSLFKKYDIADKPIWITETGVWSGQPLEPEDSGKQQPHEISEQEQAMQVVKRLIYPLSFGVKKVFWAWELINDWGFDWDFPDAVWDHYGLIYNGLEHDTKGAGVRKLSFYTYKLMIDKLEGSDWENIQTVIDGQDNVYAYKFTKQGKPIYVVWWDYFDDTGSLKTITLSVDFSGKVLITEAVPDAESGAELNPEDHPNFFKAQTLNVNDNKITVTLGKNPVFIDEK